jgi:hypothetical protein
MKRAKAIFGASISLLFLGALLFSACTNIFGPPEQPGENGRGGVTIRIAGDPPIRTLYPDAEFTKYTLEFSHATSSHAPVELTGGEISVVLTGLDDGVWTVTAKGYITIDIDGDGPTPADEFEAARGTGTISVSSGAAAPVTIDLGADMETDLNSDSVPDPGYLSWNISIPGDAGIQEARLIFIRPSDYVTVANWDLLSNPADRQGIQTLAPGYYRVHLWVFNGYQDIGHTEIAAVYSNMETTVNYTFDGADFVPTVKMSGTVTLNDTTDVEEITITGQSNSSLHIQSNPVTVTGPGNYTWEICAPKLSASTRFDFAVWVSYTDDNSIYIDTGVYDTLSNSNVPDIDLGTVSAAAVTIGGSISFTGIDQRPEFINIYSDSVNNGRGYQVDLGYITHGGEATGTWSMKVPAELAGAQAEFSLYIQQIGGTYVEKSLGTKEIPSTDTLNISFPPVDLSTSGPSDIITLSGHIDFKVNNVTPSIMSLMAFSSPDWSEMNFLGMNPIYPSGNWTITMDAPDTPITVYFWVRVQDTSGNVRLYDTGETQPNVYQTDIPHIELGQVYKTLITLSGTVSGTVDEDVPAGCSIVAWIADENKVLGHAEAESNGSWSMEVEAPSISKIVSFMVAPVVGNIQIVKRLGSTYDRTVFNTPVSGIDLTGLAITTKTISVNITNGGNPAPGSVVICNSQVVPTDLNSEAAMALKTIAMTVVEEGDPGLSTWSVKVPDDTGDMYFMVQLIVNYNYASTSPVSGNTVTLDLLEDMTLLMP